VLAKKHKDFLLSIQDENVRNLVKDNSIITGGAIASMLLNEKVNDFDYYFRNRETVEAVANYYVNRFNDKVDPTVKPIVKITDEGRITIHIQSNGIISENQNEQSYEEAADFGDAEYVTNTLGEEPEQELDDKSKYRPIFMSGNAITLSNKVQLVVRFYGEPEEIHKNYDFAHCCNYWESHNGKITIKQEALESLLSKHLVYKGSLYPLCSVIRTRKLIKAGWHINAGQYLKMCIQLSQLNLLDIKVLEDQLTGVDSAYFFQVIEYCRKRQEENNEFELSVPYLITVIDRIFG
jgi:hypothetical protein